MAEASLFVGTDGARVIFKNSQGDAAQVDLGKGKTQKDVHRIGAIAFAPIFSLTNAQPDKGIASGPVDHIEIQLADQLVFYQRADTEKIARWRHLANFLIHPL